MSQHDYDLANASGPAYRADNNNLAAAIVTQNSGSSYPGTTFPRMRVANTTLGIVARRNIANSGWLIESTDDESRVVSRSSNVILDASDVTKAFVATSSFTQTFDAAATLGEWWHCYYRNDGTGSIVLDPNGAELIDGSATKTLGPGESLIIFCTGSAFKTFGIARATAVTMQVYTSSSTWTKPAALRDAVVEVQAGGGQGGSPAGGVAGGGGGAGGYSRKRIATGSLGSTEAVTVGVGGGSLTSSFGAHCSATGGGTGGTGSPADGGVGSSGDLNIEGGGAGSGDDLWGGVGGASNFGGGGRGGNASSDGHAGAAYGSGGGGSGPSGGSGASGKGGVVIVWEFY